MSKRTTASDQRIGDFQVSLANEQSRHAVDEQQLVDAACAVLRDSGFTSVTVSLAVVDDDTIHELNRRYLNHDWATDVLSFLLESDKDHLEGEVIISADTAASAAAEFGWPTAAEQLLYVVHGMLHLIGYGDKTPCEIHQMRAAEGKYLRQFGFAQARSLEDRGTRSDNRTTDPVYGGASAP